MSSSHATPSTTPRSPSTALWASAMAGLFGLGACGDDGANVEPDPVVDAAPAVDAAEPDAPVVPDAPPEPETKIISETPGERTFAELKAMCDARGGYIEIHTACSGTNSCAGFSYGDWGEGAILTEHSCSAVSGCNGLGCVVLPPDSGKTALEILSAELPDTEGVAQRACNYCHATWDDAGEFDVTKFTVHVLPGSGRTLDNWLDRTPEAQARIIAFGSHERTADGIQVGNMAAYRQMYSRAEIERVVQYIRATATPILVETKVEDPATLLKQRRVGPGRRAMRR